MGALDSTTSPVYANIRFELAIHFTKDDQNGEWIGHTQPFGMILRGETKEDIQARLHRAADFFVTTICRERPFPESIDSIRRYLDKRRVNHSIEISFPGVEVAETRPPDQSGKLKAELELALA